MAHNHYWYKNRWPASTRALCPVCHEAVYSTAGIHPQCAVRLAESPGPKAKSLGPAVPAPAAGAPSEAGDSPSS